MKRSFFAGAELCETANVACPRTNRLKVLGCLALTGILLNWAAINSSRVSAKEVSPEDLVGNAISDLSPDVSKQIQGAINHFKAKEFDDARNSLKAAKADNKRLPPAEILFAKLCLLANLPQYAYAELERYVAANPTDPEPYLMFGDFQYQQKQVTAAEALFEKAEALAAKWPEATTSPKRQRDFDIRIHAGLSAVAEAREQWAMALTHLEAWITLDADSSAALQREGRVLFKLSTPENGRTAEALAAFKKAYTLIKEKDKDSHPTNEYVAIGRLYLETANDPDKEKAKKSTELAKKAFDLAMVKYPGDLDTLLAVVQYQLATNQLAEADTTLKEAEKKSSDSQDVIFARGLVARLQGNMPVAEKAFTTLYEKAPRNFLASNQLALVLAEQSNVKSKIDKALDLATINMQIFEKSPEAATTLGWIYWKLDRKAEAGRAMSAVVQTGQLSPDAAYYVAVINTEDGQKPNPDAVAILNEIKKSPVPFAHRSDAEKLLKKIDPNGELSKTYEKNKVSGDKKPSGDEKEPVREEKKKDPNG